jgi:hypothetical protein
MGHAGMYVQQEDGKYAFFEVTGISKEANGLSSTSTPGETKKDKWGNDTTILSNLPLDSPSPETAQAVGMPGQAGALMRVFDDKNQMIAALTAMGFDEAIGFDTTPAQDSSIYKAAVSSGQSFSGYNLLNNSCGIFARNALTIAGSGVRALNPFLGITSLGSQSIPNIIGANLILANPKSTNRRFR